jgi:integrase
MLDWQAVGTGLIPVHRLEANFLDFFSEYVERNKQFDPHRLLLTLAQFKRFIKSDFLSPHDLTADCCLRFRQYLLDHYQGYTPGSYFARFKRVVKDAAQQGYFRVDPCAHISIKNKSNIQRKENLEVEEYVRLLQTPCENKEVRDAFIFCCYTGLRWCDVQYFSPACIKTEYCIIQKKTQVEHHITLHPVAKTILEKRLIRALKHQRPLFRLPTAEEANHVLASWCKDAGIDKHITWSCARLSFSILLQDAQVDCATVSLLLGHKTMRHVYETYRRYRPKDQTSVIARLPDPTCSPSIENKNCPDSRCSQLSLF